MEDDFRRRANEDIARLLTHWREVELWIKRAEQISKKAVIPAINELRYASRQLFNATTRLAKPTALSSGEKSAINKRIIIAEQYLLNAEHDICDAVVGYFDSVTAELDRTYGPTNIIVHFAGYPLLKNRIADCQILIAGAREDYNRRGENYRTLRTNHFPHLIEDNERLTEAEVAAKQVLNNLQTELLRERAKVGFLQIVALVAALFGIFGITIPWVYHLIF